MGPLPGVFQRSLKGVIPTLLALALVLLLLSGVLASCGDIGAPADRPRDEATEETAPADPEEEPRDEEEDTEEPGEEESTVTVDKDSDEVPEPSPGEEIAVHFIDVGQGDAVLIETQDGNILIDAATRAAGDIVVQYLVRRGIRELDVVIGTHPHADHIGGLIDVFKAFRVHRIIDSGEPHTTVTFDDYLTEIEKQVEAGHATYEIPTGQVITMGAMILTVLGPEGDLGSLNDNSVVCRVDFGDTSFLFTGDAEKAAEESLLRRGVNLEADLLKIGHHGSRTSTTQAFLDAVSPAYGVIMAGEGNRYGHPHEEVLTRLVSAGVNIFRTDVHGTVVFVSDGTTLTSSEAPWQNVAQPTDPGESPGTININTATVQQLQEIVHISEARAEEITRLRPFASLDELTRVSGIGPARLEDIRDEGKAYVE